MTTKEYYLKNKKRIANVSREYYSKNKERLLKRKVVYRIENKEKIATARNIYINTERGYVMEVIRGIFNRHKIKNARPKWKPECTKQDIYDELMLHIQDHGRNCEYCKEPWTYSRPLTNEKNSNGRRRNFRIDTNFSIDR